MKLSEVIKAIEDGSENRYSQEFKKKMKRIDVWFKISIYSENGKLRIWNETNIGGDIPLDGWEEVKPPRQWSEKELMLFKLLPDKFDWIAINSVGNVFAYASKPEKIKVGERSGFNNGLGKYIRLEFDFLTITFEESPIYIGDLKGE